MTADLTICNMALGHLGEQALTQAQLTANTVPSAKACNTFFTPTILDLFREHKWPFADAQLSLNASSVDVTPWAAVYDYPTQNCAAVWSVYDESTADKKDEQDFEIKYDPTTGAKVICSNLEEALADYTHIVTDTSLWDSKFVFAASYRLASVMASTLGVDANKALGFFQLSSAMIGSAKRIGSVEQKKIPEFSSSTQNARG